MKLAGPQGGRRLDIQITYRFPHIGRKAVCRSPRRWGAVVNIARHHPRQTLPVVCSSGRPVGLCPAVECLAQALHFPRDRHVADPHFPQIMVHIPTKPVKKCLAKLS